MSNTEPESRSVDFITSEAASTERQAGQGLVEGVLALAMLATLWAAIAWLGQMQDIGLTVRHASAYAAFAAARGHVLADEVHARFFSGSAHRWTNLQGKSLLDEPERRVTMQVSTSDMLLDQAQPGEAGLAAAALRAAWGMEGGLLDAWVGAAPAAMPPPVIWPIGAATSERPAQPGRQALILRRHTSILTGAGHAIGDDDAQVKLAASALAWGNNAKTSYTLGHKVQGVMDAVDAGWRRSVPHFDWLFPWSGHVPDRHLFSYGGMYEHRVPAPMR